MDLHRLRPHQSIVNWIKDNPYVKTWLSLLTPDTIGMCRTTCNVKAFHETPNYTVIDIDPDSSLSVVSPDEVIIKLFKWWVELGLLNPS